MVEPKPIRHRGDKDWRIPMLEDYAGEPLTSSEVETISNDSAVSIVTVVLNGAKHLEETIQSVLTQDYPKIEFVIIDGGSTDRTIDIIRKYEEHIAYWVSEPDRGLYDAMNKGIARTTGKLIKILNADDVLTPSSVSTAVHLFKTADPMTVVESDLDFVGPGGALIERRGRRTGGRLHRNLHPSWYVGRSVYERFGLYKSEYSLAADQEMFVRLRLSEVPFIHAETPLVRFRSGGVSSQTWRGVAENYDLMRHYFTRRAAIISASSLALKKIAKRLLVPLVGESRMYAWRQRFSRGRSARLLE